MDIKAIIESGILEQYVLGLLSDEEKKTVEGYAKDYPEIRSALNEIEDALETVAQNNTIPMPERLPKNILQKIDSLEAEKNLPKSPDSKPTSSSKFKIPFYIFLILSILLALLSWIFFIGYQSSQEDLLQRTSRSDIEIRICEEEKTQLQNQLDIIRAKGNRQIILNGTDNAPQAIANVYYNPENNKSYLDVMSLPDVPNGKQYQLWALKDGENPTDMGVFDVDPNSNTLIEVPFVEGAIGFAVTVEDEGGSPTPTLETMVIVGTIG